MIDRSTTAHIGGRHTIDTAEHADTILPTRERLLAVATRLFLEKGYNATSVSDILHESDTNSGSLYHSFATKRDLLIGVLEQCRDGIETWPAAR